MHFTQSLQHAAVAALLLDASAAAPHKARLRLRDVVQRRALGGGEGGLGGIVEGLVPGAGAEADVGEEAEAERIRSSGSTWSTTKQHCVQW